MSKLILGMILGITVATVGFTGISRILDRGVDTVKHVARDAANQSESMKND